MRATDTGGLFVDTVLRVTIRPVNDDPFVSSPIGPVVVNEDAADTIIDLATVFDDVDIVTNGDELTYAVFSIRIRPWSTSTSRREFLSLDYQDDQFGTSTIVVVATDAGGESVSETISLTVNPVQDPTIVVDDRFRAADADPITITSAVDPG